MTVPPYDEWTLIANPGDQEARVTVEFTLADGETATREYGLEGADD